VNDDENENENENDKNEDVSRYKTIPWDVVGVEDDVVEFVEVEVEDVVVEVEREPFGV
jgi:hypothetical protein